LHLRASGVLSVHAVEKPLSEHLPCLRHGNAHIGPGRRPDYLLTVKDNPATVRKNIEKLLPAPPPGFPPQEPTATTARTVELQKERHEARTIQTQAVFPETIIFPLAAQAARLRHQTTGRKEEAVKLVTSIEPQRLSAALWLLYNRLAWDIEEMHQRLDASHMCASSMKLAAFSHGFITRARIRDFCDRSSPILWAGKTSGG
jgi:hypothetical protein